MDLSRSWEEYTYVSFDTETSGKYPLLAEVCEIAAVKWKNGKVVDTFQTFCKTRLAMDEQVIAIHKITNEMIADAPQIKDVLPGFKSFIEGSVLVAHNAPFDLGFLTVEFEKYGLSLPEAPALCSCLLSLKVFPKSINHRLGTLVQLLGVDQGQAHRALDDSRACLEVTLRCIQEYERFKSFGAGKCTLAEIAALQGGPLLWANYSMKDLEAREPFRSIVEAARGRMVLELVYNGGSQAGVPRKVTALGLVRNPTGDYFVGQCHRENSEKRFYLNKVVSAKILD